MFKKLKSRLRLKLIKYLGIDSVNAKITEHNEKIDSLHRTLQEIVKVGVDVDYSTSHSWAVVCYNHNPNTPIVKFIPLYDYNGREITEFLKRFDSGSFKIDTPFKFIEKDLLYDWKN